MKPRSISHHAENWPYYNADSIQKTMGQWIEKCGECIESVDSVISKRDLKLSIYHSKSVC